MAWLFPIFNTVATVLIFLLAFAQRVEGGGKVEVDLHQWRSNCEDNFGTTACDPYFYFCLDKPPTGGVNVHSCFFNKKHCRSSDHYETTRYISFGATICRRISNPIVSSVSDFGNYAAMSLQVETHDKDMWTSDDHLNTWSKTFHFTPARNKSLASWTAGNSNNQGGHQFWYSYRAYCDDHFYTTRCNVYCSARDDYLGHYTCDEVTGAKICRTGWTGERCNVDIDECEAGVCQNNATCSNSPGSYQCTCPEHFTGVNCDAINSLCHSHPCQNNGNCTGDISNYTCDCSYQWTGHNCETQVNHCDSSPCQNNGTCFATLGNYTCDCAPGWSGDNCQFQVFACDRSPCQQGGTCTDLPAEEYTCTCPEDFQGQDCELWVDPCLPNPCQYSGNCTRLAFNAHNCSCVTGWGGVNCLEFIDLPEAETGASTATQQSKFDWIPVLIGTVCALVLIMVILAAIFVGRRRRQKKALEKRMMGESPPHQGEVIQVAGRDNMAFHNALYDRTNRDNSLTERQRMPVPETPTAGAFPEHNLKPWKSGTQEEEGAVGGVGVGGNPYSEVDGELKAGLKGKETETRQKSAAGVLGGLTGAGAGVRTAEPAYNNPYADFEELKRRSVAMKSDSVTPLMDAEQEPDNTPQPAEENHYHDLDDVTFTLNNTTNNTTTDVPNTPPLPSLPAPPLPSPRTSGNSLPDPSPVEPLPPSGNSLETLSTTESFPSSGDSLESSLPAGMSPFSQTSLSSPSESAPSSESQPSSESLSPSPGALNSPSHYDFPSVTANGDSLPKALADPFGSQYAVVPPRSGRPQDAAEAERLESTDEEDEEAVDQEDLNKLRNEVFMARKPESYA